MAHSETSNHLSQAQIQSYWENGFYAQSRQSPLSYAKTGAPSWRLFKAIGSTTAYRGL